MKSDKPKIYERHYEESALIQAAPKTLFAFVDDHSHLSSHMGRSSWMMGGGRMKTETDKRMGRAVGSHIRLSGKVLGISLFVDEVVTQRKPPRLKVWETVATKLLVVGNYKMGLEISDENGISRFRVFIDYEFPPTGTRWLGRLFGGIYAKWCVRQMVKTVREYFDKRKEKDT